MAVVPTVSRHDEGVAAVDLLWGRRLRDWYQSIARENLRGMLTLNDVFSDERTS